MKEPLVNLAILTGALAVAVAVAELGIRRFGRVPMVPTQYTTDSALVYKLKPNVRGRAIQPGMMDYRWTTNSQSFRGPSDYSIAKPPGVRRVLALGDSYTFGIGVNDAETYAALSEAALRHACPDSIEVINAGVGGYGTSQELELYERHARKFDPDVVILGMMTNDFDDTMLNALHVVSGDSVVPKSLEDRPRMMGAKRFTEMIPGYSWLITHSAIVNGLRAVYFGVRARSATGTHGGLTMDSHREPTPEAIALQRAVLRRLRDRIAADSAKFVVLLMLGERSAARYYAGERDKARVIQAQLRVCAELDLQCIDVGDWMMKNAPSADLKALYIQGDGHFTAEGQRLAAGALRAALIELVGCSQRVAALLVGSNQPV